MRGLRDAGIDLGDADLIVGSSAGAVVGGQLAAGRPEELYERQLGDEVTGPAVRLGPLTLPHRTGAVLTSRTPEACGRAGRVQAGAHAERIAALLTG